MVFAPLQELQKRDAMCRVTMSRVTSHREVPACLQLMGLSGQVNANEYSHRFFY